MSSYWEVIASKRANSSLDKIPLEWRLSQDDLAYAKSQKNLKTVIPRFLNEYERKIVKMDTVQILGMTQNGQWRVKDVVEAHCKIACIAHQIVWIYDSLFFSNFSVFFFHPTEKSLLTSE